MAVGVALSLSGLQMQTLFRNPLAGPFVLGISSGASFGVAILVMGSSILPLSLGHVSIAFAASLGSVTVLLVILALAKKLKDSTSLLIIGLMFGSAVTAGVSILQYFGNPEEVQGYLFWTFGSLSGVTWTELRILLPVTIVGFLFTLVLSKPMNVVLLGDDYATSSGISLTQIRLLLILCTSLLAGISTAFCGPIAFVGIAVPHIARLTFNTSNLSQLAPIVAIMGAGIMIVCDLITQLPGFAIVIPINAVTSLFGAPLIIWLIIRRKKMVAF